MKLHLLSDLHMEFRGSSPVEDLIQPADVLILAGDIDVGTKKVAKRLEEFSKHYEHVLYTPGNHEYYDYGIPGIFELEQLPSNVHVLNPGTVTLNGTKFIGATLWTNFNNEDRTCLTLSASYINDFRRVNATTKDYVQLFKRDLAFIQEHATPKAVIFTHFMPYRMCIHPKWTLDPTTRVLNGYFCNELPDIPAQIWMFGHTHDAFAGERRGTQLFANPKGYPNENPFYNPVIVEV